MIGCPGDSSPVVIVFCLLALTPVTIGASVVSVAGVSGWCCFSHHGRRWIARLSTFALPPCFGNLRLPKADRRAYRRRAHGAGRRGGRLLSVHAVLVRPKNRTDHLRRGIGCM